MPNFNVEKGLDIDDATAQVGETYFDHKRLKEALEDGRLDFFKAASRTFAEKDLARKTVEIPEDQSSDPEGYALRYNPGWRVVETHEDSVVIQEDPDFQPFTRVYSFDEPREAIVRGKTQKVYGYVVTRVIQSGSAFLDDERLVEVDPDFYKEVTTWANLDLIHKIEIFHNDIWYDLEDMNWPRELKPLEDLTKEQYNKVQQFSYEGPKVIKLNVRYAKQSDLEE